MRRNATEPMSLSYMRKSLPLITLLSLFFLVYVLLPNNNASADSYGYAFAIKEGAPLYSPHHLLYNWLYHYMSLPIRSLIPDIDVLRLCCVFNGLFSVASLYVLYRILSLMKVDRLQIYLWVAFCGSSFGIWRFSQENESYIICIFLSLVSSLYFIKHLLEEKKYLLPISGFLGQLAILFHQIHFFWWLGILVAFFLASLSWKSVWLYCLPALIVPLAYIFALYQSTSEPITLQAIIQYALHDYYTGAASGGFSFKSVVLFIAVAIVRTFVQVYPYMLILIKQHWVYLVPLALATAWLAGIILALSKRKKIWQLKPQDQRLRPVVYSHLIILLLHISFAFLSHGNAEFMIMTPILLAVILAPKIKYAAPYFAGLSLTMFVWNGLYAAYPHFEYKISDQRDKIAFLKQYPNAIYISTGNLILNQNAYLGGSNAHFYNDQQLTEEVLTRWLSEGQTVFTDMPDDKKLLNRGRFMKKNLNDEVWKKYKLQVVHTVQSIYGPLHLYQVSMKN